MQDDLSAAILAALPGLRRYAISLCRRPDQADDLVQTAVERALAARARLPAGAPVQPWLFRILRNAWIDGTRRARTRGTEIDIDDAPDAAVTDGPRTSEARLMLAEVTAALDTLPQAQREVVVLVCMQELSYAEAAEVMGVAQGTVMSRLARARAALAGKLGIT